jgi:RecA-family ATPase
MFHRGHEYLAQPRPAVTWLVKDMLPAGGFSNIYGKPKAGKSFLALGQAIAISSGQPHWMGIPVMTHGPVAYLQIDTPRSLWMERLENINAHGHDISNIFFADADSGIPYPFNIMQDGPVLAQLLAQIKPLAIYIDTIRELHPGDENDSGTMKNVMAMIQEACRPAAVVLVSHKKKEGQTHIDDLMNDARGSSYISGRMDSVCACSTQRGNDSKGNLIWQSRTTSLKDLKMIRSEEDGMWSIDGDEQRILQAVGEVLAEDYDSDRARAEVLAMRLDITVPAARGHLRRKKDIFKGRLKKG